MLHSRLSVARLAALLSLPAEEAEGHLADLVVAKALAAKIDRPAGEIRFAPRQTPEDVLNAWSGNVSKLLGVVEKACASIQKESMLYKVPIGNSA